MMDISLVIINYKTPEILNLAVKSLKSTISGIKYEIIIVDVESDYKTEYSIKDNFPGVTFLPIKKNVGYSKSVNAGLNKCDPSSRYIFILNADIVAKAESVGKLFAFMESHGDVGVTGPELLNFNNTFQNSYFRFYTPKIILYRRTFMKNFLFAQKALDDFLAKGTDHNRIQTVEWLMGSALFIRKSALEKVGLMDERFFMYFEDVDWCRRFWNNGYKVVYFPEAKMMHYHGKQSSGSAKYAIIHIASAVKYFWKYRGKPIPKIAREFVSQTAKN
jgi:N-acetylglucosaminyl-diphospho-decaprenol L-rhamnosyltransferase